MSASTALKCTCLSLFLITGYTCADTIHLKNGDVISGKLVSLADGKGILSTPYGAALVFATNDLFALETEEPFKVTFMNGDQVNGTLDYTPSQKTILRSRMLAASEIDPSQIVSMKKDFSPAPGPTASSTTTSLGAAEYGEQNPTNAPLDFLVGSTVLLTPGQYEVDFGLGYKASRSSYSLQQTGYFERSAYTARQNQLSAALRGGITEGLEAYVSVPYTYSRIEDVSTNANVRDTSEWRLGDISFGLQYLLLEETLATPALSFTFDASAPTGKKHYRDYLQNWKDPLDNSSGHWSIAPGIAFVRTTDPAILFGGLSYRYAFARTIDSYRIQPGWSLETYAGLGFALNEKLSLGTRLGYAYNARMKAEGQTIYGSDSEPVDLSFSASYNLDANWVVSPRLSYSLNDDAGPAALSVNLKRRFL